MKQIVVSIVLLAFIAITNYASACTPSPCWMGSLESYYENVVPWSPQSMRESLHETIDDHERFPYTSSEIDTWNILEEADRISAESTDIITIYRNARYTKRGGGNDFYNREHTWPKSYGFPDNGPELNYPDTDGQGFFITVFPNLDKVSLAWFTYDTAYPAEDAQANLGDPGHRWLTALGPITGNQSVMNIDIASGGIFDSATEIEHTEPIGSDGTITLTFKNCNEGSVTYNIPSIGRQGTVPIRRIVDDNILLCERLSQLD